MAANKPKEKRKEESGSNPQTVRGKRNAKTKPHIKVTAVDTIDFGINPAFAHIGKPEEPKAQTVEKPEAPKAQPAPKTPTVPGVRAMRTRPYLAGTIIAKHGLADGVTDGMVAELDKAYEKPNPTESRICLKNAHHAARGYLGITESAIE